MSADDEPTERPMYAEHLLHLHGLDEGLPDFRLTCVDMDRCEHVVTFHDDGSRDCTFVTWWENVGSELLIDRPKVRGVTPFPVDPTFPLAVQPWDWTDDGVRVAFDPRPVEPF